MRTDIDALADRVLGVLSASAESDYIGEDVNQLEHALQAAHFAREAGASDAQVLAALTHDIGHLLDPEAPSMAGLGVIDHERVGADYLRSLGGEGYLSKNEVRVRVTNPNPNPNPP